MPDRRRLLRDDARVHQAARPTRWTGKTAKPRTPEFIPSASSLYTAQPFLQDNSVFVIGERCNTNGSRKFKELIAADDYEATVRVANASGARGLARARRLRRLHRTRRRPGHARGRVPLRDAGDAAARRRLDGAAGRRGRVRAPRRTSDPQLDQPRGRHGRRHAPRAEPRPRAEVRRRRHRRRDRGEGPGDDGRLEARRLQAAARRLRRGRPRAARRHLRHARAPDLDRHGGGAQVRHRDARLDRAREGRDPRDVHRRSASPTSRSASTPPDVRSSTPSIWTKPSSAASTWRSSRPRRSCRSLASRTSSARSRSRSSTTSAARATTRCSEFLELFEGASVSKTATEDELAGLPLDERLARRIVDAARKGLEDDLDRGARGEAGARDRQRLAARTG